MTMKTMPQTVVTEFKSGLWPDMRAKVWNVGNAWFCCCWSENHPLGARTENFVARTEAIEHARVVLGSICTIA